MKPISIRYLSARDAAALESSNAEILDAVEAGLCAQGRGETCLLWHRGLSTSDIALGAAMLEKADRFGIGHSLPYA